MFLLKEPIFVVEDDAMIRNLITIYLNKNGYAVIEAEDGERAKELFLKYHPCLIILNLMLPKISGEVFCKWVRKGMNNKDVSIIILSAKSQVGDKINGLQMGNGWNRFRAGYCERNNRKSWRTDRSSFRMWE